MRLNEYSSIDDFVDEYAYGRSFSWQNADGKERFMGIEFENAGIYYRMCREPYDKELTPVLPNGRPGLYNIMIMHCKKHGYPVAGSFESIGWYDSLDTLLKECMLGNRSFGEIIVADETTILGKD